MSTTEIIHTEIIVETTRVGNVSKEYWKEIKSQDRNLENAHLV